MSFFSVFGDIKLPKPLEDSYGVYDKPGGGIALFFGNFIKLITLGAGLFAVINFILAGLEIMNASGDPEKMGKAIAKIWGGFLGIVIMVLSFAFASLIGWVVFHDQNAILNLKIFGPGISP